MKTTRNIILGIILIVIGIALAGDALNLFHFNLFFKGWWTLFIIIPSIIGLVSDEDKKGNLIGLIIGILLLLACYDIINFEIIWKLLLPVIIIVFGFSLIFKNYVDKEVTKNIDNLKGKLNKNDGYAGIFSSQDIKLDNEKFKGTNMNAIFGAIKFDLREAIIDDDVLIDATSVFGGIDIFVPDNVIVKIKSTSLFGGVSNKKSSRKNAKDKIIYINANCIFGGVTIKWQ